jgi:hypothetical protein
MMAVEEKGVFLLKTAVPMMLCAEHKLLSQQGEKVVIFCDVVTKINKVQYSISIQHGGQHNPYFVCFGHHIVLHRPLQYYKSKDVALMVTADNFYKYDYKKYKQIKKVFIAVCSPMSSVVRSSSIMRCCMEDYAQHGGFQ